ncbi:hypothetical protein V6N11_081127 [Hibiscus sabdariffa]|uniref:Uncharacterized protein n=1 Tax=Hibiscus sabdariffa TaxID=183260 RepID=A0ABR2QIZ8_9ROSI
MDLVALMLLRLSMPSVVVSRDHWSCRCFHFVGKMANQLGSLVESIKSKVRALKKNSNKPYIKMDKSSSVKVEIRSRKARKLIDKTLKAADRPGKRTLS